MDNRHEKYVAGVGLEVFAIMILLMSEIIINDWQIFVDVALTSLIAGVVLIVTSVVHLDDEVLEATLRVQKHEEARRQASA